jgi:hypothetical protein
MRRGCMKLFSRIRIAFFLPTYPPPAGSVGWARRRGGGFILPLSVSDVALAKFGAFVRDVLGLE